MITEEINGIKKLKSGGEGHVLFIAQTGATKTLAIERFVEEHHKKGHIVVYIESSKANLEAGASAFKPTMQYHLNKLKFQGENPQSKKIKLYHLNSNIPTFKTIPELKIWTMNIKKFDRLLTSFIFENSGETSSISALNTAIERLKKNEGFFDLIVKLKQGNIKEKQDLFSFESKASSINVNTILNFLGRFKDQPIIMPQSFKHNLDIVKILQDQTSYHIFSNRYSNDEKIRDLATLYILNEIRRAKASGKIKKEIIIVLDELKTIAPNNPLYDFQRILNKLLTELLSVCRSLGIRIIGASQIYSEIDSAVRQSFSHIILGRTSALQDLYDIGKIIGLNQYERDDILSLKHNEFYLLSEDVGEKGIWHFHLPKHAHAERNQVFDKQFSETFPERMKNHKDIINEIKKEFKNQELNARQLLYAKKND